MVPARYTSASNNTYEWGTKDTKKILGKVLCDGYFSSLDGSGILMAIPSMGNRKTT
jgi:hypothetical protein